MKLTKVCLFALLVFAVSQQTFAHDEKEANCAIAKAVEAELKAAFDSESTSKEIKEFSRKLLKDQYKSEKVGRFWVKEVNE